MYIEWKKKKNWIFFEFLLVRFKKMYNTSFVMNNWCVGELHILAKESISSTKHILLAWKVWYHERIASLP